MTELHIQQRPRYPIEVTDMRLMSNSQQIIIVGIIYHQFVQFMFHMKEQSEQILNSNEIQLSLGQLIELSNYEIMLKNQSKFHLGISDYDINHRQTSQFYVQKRRNIGVPDNEPSKLLDKIGEQNKTFKKSKVQNVKKNKQATIRLSKLSTNIAEQSRVVNDIKTQQQKQAVVVEVKEFKASKKKVQTVKSKKEDDSDKLSSYTLKQFQKQKYAEQNIKKQAPKTYLSEFMKANKHQIALQNESNLSKHPKTQKSSPVIEKVQQVDQNDKFNHQKPIIECPKPSQQSRMVEEKSRIYQLPENYKNPSKSKSKSRIKKAKETSFVKKSPIKIIKESEYQNHSIMEQYNPKIYNQYVSASKSIVIQKKQRQNNGKRKRINVKCENIIPTQDFQGQISHLQESYAEYNHKEQFQQFPKYMHNHSVQLQHQHDINNPKIQVSAARFDFFEIDMKPLHKQTHKQQGVSMIEINSDLKSKQEHKITINPKTQHSIIQHNHHQSIIQAEKPSPIMKSGRKKIFQQITSKPIRAQSESTKIELNNLNEEQMRLLLGGKGNKYKQAIILEYIKENRRCMAT